MNGNIVDTHLDSTLGSTAVASWPLRPCPNGCDPTWTTTFQNTDAAIAAVSGGGGVIAVGVSIEVNGQAMGRLLVLDPADGHQRWSSPTLPDAPLVTVAGSVIYGIGAYTGRPLTAWPTAGCGATTCAPAWSTPGPGPDEPGVSPAPSSAIVISQGRLYYARLNADVDDHGGILAFALNN